MHLITLGVLLNIVDFEIKYLNFAVISQTGIIIIIINFYQNLKIAQ